MEYAAIFGLALLIGFLQATHPNPNSAAAQAPLPAYTYESPTTKVITPTQQPDVPAFQFHTQPPASYRRSR